MKILFLCSSLEPGKDGVGDYTRKFSCALNKEGCTSKIIALNDRRLKSGICEEWQYDIQSETEVLRLPESLPWKIRLQKAKEFTSAFNPQWISMQYVPFGFHIKGLPFNLGSKMAQLATDNRWHIMFHELSVNKEESLKFKIWSLLQVNIIKSLIQTLKPAVINTNTELYKYRLKQMGFDASVLPLFSNISNKHLRNEDTFNSIVPTFIRLHQSDYIIGTLFGSFDFKRWDMRSLLNKFKAYSFSKKRTVIVSIGKMSAGAECWQQLKKEFAQVILISLGEQSPEFISYWLNNYTHFGILTTLPELAGKSGSFMAFKEHGVPVVCKEKTASLALLNLPVEEGLTEIKDNTNFHLPSKQEPAMQLRLVTEKFLNELRNEQPITVHCQPSTEI